MFVYAHVRRLRCSPTSFLHTGLLSLDFRADRKQLVKIENFLSTNAGVPQATISGPTDFKHFIIDLAVDSPYMKYLGLDKTTLLSIS
jgi:hypothetical protein